MWKLFKGSRPSEDTGDRVERLEKAMRRLEEEWSDVYHKFRVLQMRVAKQVQRLDQAPPTEETRPAEGDGENISPGASSLSPRQQEFVRGIYERRRKLAAQKGGE